MTDDLFMRRALELAELGRYGVSPNPMVGCVIVRDGAIIAEGWHRRAGEAHAEVDALRNCSDPRGATMYVTLEPCCHHGRTPPCVDAIRDAGIARVVIAMRDPNEVVDGRGIEKLHGIEITTGVLEHEARKLNEKFVWAMSQKSPFVLLKAGMTLDGKLATITRESQWITSSEARERSLMLREEYDAIAIGSGTVIADNPRLTRRLGVSTSITPFTRVVLDARGEAPAHAQLFADGGRTILFTPRAPQDLAPSVEVVEMPLVVRQALSLSHAPGMAGQAESLSYTLDLVVVLRELYARGIRSLLVEGGSLLHSSFISRGLSQKMIVFVAPAIVGGAEAPSIFSGEPVSRLTDAYRFRFDRVEVVGSDLMITAYPVSS